MDKFDRILRESAEEETQSLPLDDMWNVLKKKEQKKARKRRRFLQMSSMAAMLVMGLGLGLYAGRSPIFFGPPYVVVPPKAEASPDAMLTSPPQTAEPGNVEPDSTTVEPPQASPDSAIIEPPKTNAATFIIKRQFDNLVNLEGVNSARDLLPGWLPDSLAGKDLLIDDSGEYWEAVNPDDQGGPKIVLRIDSSASINQAIDEGILGLPDDLRAETLPIGSGMLIYYGSEDVPDEIWWIRVGEDTYLQCYSINISRSEVINVIEYLGG